MINKTRVAIASLFGFVAILNVSHAQAVCDQSGASAADADTAAAINCNASQFSWFFKTRGLIQALPPEYTWQDRGHDDPCNSNKELHKLFTSHILVATGIEFSVGSPLLLERAFHSGEDYAILMAADAPSCPLTTLPSAAQRCWHNHTYVNRADDSPPTASTLARFSWSTTDYFFWSSSHDTLSTYCTSFDAPRGAAARAATSVHEAWHAHWRELNFDDHVEATAATETAGCAAGTECDTYFPHTKSEFPARTLYSSDLPGIPGARTAFGAYQAGLEAACDMSDNPAAWVPLSAQAEAEATAQAIGMRKFYNGPVPFNCGTPSPLDGILPLIRGAASSGCGIAPCTTTPDCGDDELKCVTGCCVIVPQ